ncbi:MAG: hypothetical protein AAFQ58_23600 [Pseudomonadota bacterium]
MNSVSRLIEQWPIAVAASVSAFLFVTTAAEDAEVPQWLKDAFASVPETPPKPAPSPKAPDADAPYAPVPGRDDRTPIAFMNLVFGLDDPSLEAKLSGIGPVFWDHAGRGTGAMISPTVVLSTAHLFVERGKWDGPHGFTEKPPAPSDGRIYLPVCGRSYDFAKIELGSMSPRANLGGDYAIAVLEEPVCEEAAILPVSLGPDDIAAGGDDQIFMDLGFYGYREVARYADHPIFTKREVRADGMHKLAMFGVVCDPVQNQATKPVPGGTTGLIISDGCDGLPGSSGGPALLSRDGGATYTIVGVSNSYRKTDPEYNNYTRIEGALAAHLAGHVTLVDLPEADGPAQRSVPHPIPGPWLPTDFNQQEEVQ